MKDKKLNIADLIDVLQPDLIDKGSRLLQELAMKFLPQVDGTLACRVRELYPPNQPESLTDKVCTGRRLVMAEVLQQLIDNDL